MHVLDGLAFRPIELAAVSSYCLPLLRARSSLLSVCCCRSSVFLRDCWSLIWDTATLCHVLVPALRTWLTQITPSLDGVVSLGRPITWRCSKRTLREMGRITTVSPDQRKRNLQRIIAKNRRPDKHTDRAGDAGMGTTVSTRVCKN